MKTLRTLLTFVLFAMLASTAQAQTRYYVDWDCEGTPTDGLAWATAYLKLQDALAVAVSGDEIWVAAGTYYPDEGTGQTDNARTSRFTLRNGVEIYGGFYGSETLLGERDVAANPTILSGDLDQDGTSAGNAYHVVKGNGVDATAVLDGFTITAGNANGSGSKRSGAGLFAASGSPTLTGLTITGNTAQYDGAGVFLDGSNAAISQSTIAGNTASRNGGGLYLLNSSPSITNTTVTDNTATGKGGGLYIDSSSGPALTSVTITDNAASSNGGGLFNQSSSTAVQNSILWSNSDQGGNGYEAQLYNSMASPMVSYSVVKNSGGSGTDWQNNLGADGGGNLASNPMLGVLADNGGPTQTQLPGDVSPVIDAGSCYSLSEDQRGDTKPYDATDKSFPNSDDGCDIGAVELQADEVFAPECSELCYVDKMASGAGDGSSWADAFTSLQDALYWSTGTNEIWVAAGTYYPDQGIGQTNNNRNATFALITGVAIYGGFDGTETLLEERDIAVNVTILSGNINGGGAGGNAYHVVTGSSVDSTAVLDGFTITAGYANGDDARQKGGGLYIGSGSPMLVNNTVNNNTASGYSADGGGLYIGSGSPTLIDNTIEINSALGEHAAGGGLYIGSGSPTLIGNTISTNDATGTYADGGGLYIGSGSPMLANNTIAANSASGASTQGGGLYVKDGSPTLIGNTIVYNTAGVYAGGILISAGSISIRNTILWGNSDASGTDASAQIYNTVGATAAVSYSIVQGGLSAGTSGSGNLDADPLLGALADNGGPTQTRLPANNSPAIDAGSCFGQTEDQRGESRPYDDPATTNDGDGCDIGAVELQASELPGASKASSAPSGETHAAAVPSSYALAANYPNPFNPTTRIAFDVPETSEVRLVVFDVTGREVARLVSGTVAAGRHEVAFDAHGLPSGLYLYRLQAGAFSQVRRMMLVK